MIEFPDLSLCLSVEIFHELDMVSEEFGVAVGGILTVVMVVLVLAVTVFPVADL
jgi:hypothetical protein